MIEEKKEETVETAGLKDSNGKDLENINIVCSKHGLINNGAFYIRYSTIQKADDKNVAVDNNNIFCIACLNDLYMKFQKDGVIGNLSLNVKYADEEKPVDVPVEQAEFAEDKKED